MSSSDDETVATAFAALRSGNLSNAELHFKILLRSQPNHVGALNLLGVLLTQLERYEEAEPYIHQAIKIYARSDVSFYNYGIVLKNLKRPLEALSAFNKAIGINPTVAETWNNRGAVLSDLARYDEAIDDFDKAISLQPNYAEAFSNKGKSLILSERYDEALAAYDKALKINPRLSEAYLGRGHAFGELKHFEEALPAYEAALEIKPNLIEAWIARGTTFCELKRYDEAVADFDKALRLDPKLAEAWFSRGNVCTLLGDYGEGLAAFDKALAVKPDFAEALLRRGNICALLKRFKEAFAAYDKALTIKPDLAEAWLGRGNILAELKQYDDAFAAYDKVLTLKPDLAEAWSCRGNILMELKQYDSALAAYDRALTFKSDLAEAWVGRGNILTELKQYDNALAAYDRALTFKPDLAGAWVGRGNVFKDLEQYDKALAAYDRVLTLNPDLAEAWLCRGDVCTLLRGYDEALVAFDKALAVKPDFAEALLRRGNVCALLKRFEEARAAYDKALTLKPDLAEAWLGRGNVLGELMRHVEAAQSYGRLLEVAPEYDFAKSYLLHQKMLICDWQSLDIESINRDVRERKKSVEPWPYQAISNSAEDLRQCAEIYTATRFPRSPIQIWSGEKYNNPKIRIGYSSGDFRKQAVSILMAELFELHNRDRFELYAFDNGWDDGSDIRKRINKAFDSMIDITRLGDLQAATIINQSKIDILVNLSGYTGRERTAVFGHRPSPVHVNYLGFSSTMGADYVDYIIADPYIIPPELQIFYTEKVVYLPDAFQVSNSKRTIADRTPSRSELMLPDKGFVFCCFNNTFKITPTIFDVWMRLLKEVEGSVLWLSEGNAVASHNLRLEAERRGIAPERLVVSEKAVEYSDYLARYRLADLFLDTFPFNAGTIANDVLWVGTPLITCSGETYPARMAGSLLTAIGVPELITNSLEEYEALALKLARDPKLLASIKAKLTRNRATHPLFDTARFVRHIESAYTIMWERSQRGEPPASFSVEAL